MEMRKVGHGRWPRRGGWLLSVAIGVLLVLPNAISPAGAQSSDFDVLFTVDVDAATVNVELNTQTDSQLVTIQIHAGAIDVEAQVDGASASVTLGEADDFSVLVTIDAPTSGELWLRYAIPSDPPRSAGNTRVNPAHISFFAWVDLNLGTGSVRVELPAGFRGDNYGGQLRIDDQTLGNEAWVTDSIAASDLLAVLVARNERGLRRSVVYLNSTEVAIAGWADDAEWIEFAQRTVERGVPLLQELIGQPWPESDLVVIESTEPYTEGLAGWFDVWGSEINVGDELDEATMLHELAHAWFNYVRLEDRWMVEGWAEDYSSLALSKQRGSDVTPPAPDVDAAGSSNLVDWNNARDDNFDSVQNSYDTSWYVLHTIREEIGTEAMAGVLGAMLEGRSTYHVTGDPAVYPANTTARFLDLLEEIGGSVKATALFETYVFSNAWDARLAERSEARGEYADLKAIGAFLAPKLIRDRMEEWKFGEARLLIAEAAAAATRLVSLDAHAKAVGAQLPKSLISSYEGSAVSFRDVGEDLSLAEDAMDWIASLEGAELDTAVARFEVGNYTLVNPGTAAEDGGASLPWLPIAVAALVLVSGVFIAAQFRAARNFQ